jgi:hypothetical protein
MAAGLATAVAGLTEVAPAASAATSYGYVIMGDSLAAGEGAYGTYLSGTNTSANMCHRSTQSYGAQYAATSISSYIVTNVACSGAGTSGILAAA